MTNKCAADRYSRIFPLCAALLVAGCRGYRAIKPIPVEAVEAEQHLLGAAPPLRLSEAEWKHLQARGCDYYVPFELIVSPVGRVQSARLLPYTSSCGPSAPAPELTPHLDEAVRLLRQRSYTPWRINGEPAAVTFRADILTAPPERYGADVPFPTTVDSATVKISLQRRGCEGRCPVYLVSISADGTVNWTGYGFVAVPGHHTAHISKSEVEQLLDRFRKAGFLSALPSYSGAVDGGLNTLHLEINGAAHEVVDESGLSDGLPTAVGDLEQAIDEAADTRRWINLDESTLPSLDAEHWDFGSASQDNIKLYDQSIWRGNHALIDRFVQAGAPVLANPSAGEPSWLRTNPPPLITASGTGNIPLVQQMLASVKQPLTQPMLFHCLLAGFGSGSLAMVNFWMDHDANPHLKPVGLDGRPIATTDGVDPLRQALVSGNPDVVRRALGLGFEPNRLVGGSTALAYEFQNVIPANINSEVVRLLLQAGANPASRTIGGETILEAARGSKCSDCATELEAALGNRK